MEYSRWIWYNIDMSEIILNRIKKLGEVYTKLAERHPRAVREITLAEIPEQVFNSNAIENSTLTLKDTEDILLRGQIQRDAEIREVYEAKNLARVIELLLENPQQNLTVELMLTLHKILLTGINDGYAGRFRSGNEWVRVGTHIGANPDFVNDLIYKLVENYNRSDERELIVKIAYFHNEFEYIHPFCDGNGRIGRVLINQQLMRAGLPPIIIPAKNKFQEYYPALDAYDKKNSTVELEEYLGVLVLEALNRYISIMEGKKIIPVAEWAKVNKASAGAILNKAKRQTVPAFRQRGQWMIAEDFVDGDGDGVEVGE